MGLRRGPHLIGRVVQLVLPCPVALQQARALLPEVQLERLLQLPQRILRALLLCRQRAAAVLRGHFSHLQQSSSCKPTLFGVSLAVGWMDGLQLQQ
eukprot:SAG22_NODE_3585_length_1630_cov_2.011104_2_plen_95_part_01